MSRVYVDRSLAGAPGASEALRHLSEAGHDVVPVSAPPPADRLGDDTVRPAWLLTASVELCVERPAGITTVFVGPRRPATRGPLVRCDLEARDLGAAVLEILSREAMGQTVADR